MASEEVACGSGVLLTDRNIKSLSLRYGIDELAIWSVVTVKP